ncbi:hypothetical protein P167DRAFT_63922 [Morchella conica CCBAS932]|uniref:Uncharacterized protein n=1 Tax=Morchella conica CCBAS932 TaxID=1392247 RepID=A0A3N4KUM9_9PEZI|nr:hypothetical protein P167DRAFT_63922 [Morchella conica CCBAS932]
MTHHQTCSHQVSAPTPHGPPSSHRSSKTTSSNPAPSRTPPQPTSHSPAGSQCSSPPTTTTPQPQPRGSKGRYKQRPRQWWWCSWGRACGGFSCCLIRRLGRRCMWCRSLRWWICRGYWRGWWRGILRCRCRWGGRYCPPPPPPESFFCYSGGGGGGKWGNIMVEYYRMDGRLRGCCR